MFSPLAFDFSLAFCVITTVVVIETSKCLLSDAKRFCLANDSKHLLRGTYTIFLNGQQSCKSPQDRPAPLSCIEF